jgi:beta-phosphoglucomutase-like phosphatase (HAD superfamily)
MAVKLDSFILDLDGVVTDTAQIHFEAWRKMSEILFSKRIGNLQRIGGRENIVLE